MAADGQSRWKATIFTEEVEERTLLSTPVEVYGPSCTIVRENIALYLKRVIPITISQKITQYRFADSFNVNTPDDIDRFLQSLIIETGPDYVPSALVVDGVIQPHLVGRFWKTEDETVLPLLRSRGWQLLAVESGPEQPTQFLYGHPEADCLVGDAEPLPRRRKPRVGERDYYR